ASTAAEVFEELGNAIEELRVAEEELRQQNEELAAAQVLIATERQRYQELFEFAPDGYVVTDLDGKILEANWAAVQLLNVSRQFLIGEPLGAFVVTEDRRAFRDTLAHLQRVEQLPEHEIRLQPRKSQPFVASFTVAAARTGGAAPTLRWLLRDISARKAMEATIRAAEQRLAEERATAQLEAGRLAELDRLRSEFVASASHTLRTPLTAIRAALGLLQTSAGERLEPMEVELITNARRNTARLTALINDLLTLNQLEAGTFQLEPGYGDLRGALLEALSVVEPLVRGKGQQVALDLPEPLLAHVDARRMEQVVVNILSNAHRHTPAGTRVTIAGRVASNEVLVSIHDTGPGIPREALEAIFDRFYRISPEEGSGLGLAIARALVELHGGRLWAESAPGDGATFHIALPRSQTAASDPRLHSLSTPI
ncbi:MAG TPA: ATP-binding protein, partial [Ardenticatenaceae bacterium]|nr:ATP-binding protein [Ardenticatenaceae bacterium]